MARLGGDGGDRCFSGSLAVPIAAVRPSASLVAMPTPLSPSYAPIKYPLTDAFASVAASPSRHPRSDRTYKTLDKSPETRTLVVEVKAIKDYGPFNGLSDDGRTCVAFAINACHFTGVFIEDASLRFATVDAATKALKIALDNNWFNDDGILHANSALASLLRPGPNDVRSFRRD